MVYQSYPQLPINYCDISCNNPQTSSPSAMLMIGPNETGINLTIQQAQLQDPYSIIGIEIVYTKSMNSNLQINLNSWSTQEFNSPKQSGYIDNYSNFNCSPFEDKFYSSYMYNQVSSYNGDILIQINKLTSDTAISMIGIRNINIWTNCKLGCKTCSDSTTCIDCLLPIKPLSYPSWAINKVFCPHNYGCEENLSGCNLCYFDGSTQYYCAQCKTYKSLSFYGTCYGGTELCDLGYMYTNFSCLQKGNNCVVYNRNTNQLSDCDLTKIDINNYQCSVDQTATIFEYNNYSQYICNCYFYGGYECQKCVVKGSCSQCSSMMYYDTTDKICKQFTCPYGKYPTLSLQCLPCVTGCQKCTNNNNCSQCINSAEYFDGTKCSPCPIKNCFVCNNSGLTCNYCSSGYKLATANTQCVKSCSIANCAQCFDNGTNYCIYCEAGYAIKSTNDACINCTTQFCQSCLENSLNQCKSCISGYFFISQDSTCIPCQVENCQQCVSNSYSQCQICSSSYSINQFDKTCELCQVPFCSVCQSDDSWKCSQCTTGHYIKQSDYSCEPCTVANCLSCISNDQYKCQNCDDGYYVQSNDQSCQPCPFQNCSICNEATIFECTKCKSGYYWIQSDLQCKPCQVQNCIQCNASSAFICDICKANYEINPIDDTCSHICEVTNCDICINNDHTKCQTCKVGYYINSTNLICEPCQVQNCDNCYLNSQYNCINCSNGYILQEGGTSCQQCFVSNCLICQMNDPNKCLQCQNNLFPNPNIGNCEQCQVNNCQTCINQNSLYCQKCNNSNYSLSSNGQCLCNLQNCSQCDDFIVGKCLKCNENLILNEKYQCKPKCLVDNCIQCQQTDPSQCEVCEQIYYLDLDYKCQLNNFTSYNKKTTYKLIQTVIDDGIQIKIQFNQDLNIIPKLSNQILIVEIIDYDNFKYKIVSITSREILINLTFNESVKSQIVRITFTNTQFTNLNLIQDKEIEDNLQPYTKLSQQQKDAIAASTAVGNTVSMTLVSSFLPLAIFGHFYILINTIDYTSFLFYLMYINIRHPENVVSFYGIFKNFQFPFIPNILQYIVPDDYVLQSHKKFMEMGTDAYFLRNGGQSITICLMIISMYFGARILKNLPIKSLKSYLQQAIKETWHYAAFLDMLCTVYIYLLVSSLVQFINMDFNDRLGICILNYSLHFISTILTVTIPFIMFAFIYRLKNLKNDKEMQTKITTLVGGLNLYNESEMTTFFINPNDADDNQKEYKQTALIQNELQELEKQQDQNDIYSLKIYSSLNVKSPRDNTNDTKKEFFHSTRDIFINQNEPLDSNDKQICIPSHRNSIILQQSFNNLQNRGKSNSNQSKFLSSEVIINKKDKKSKQKFIDDRRFSELILIPKKYQQQKPLREKLQIKFSKQYNSLLYIRKLFFSLIIVYLYDHCYTQLVLISLLNLFISSYIFFIKPFEKNSENIKAGICELLLVCIHICIMFLVTDRQDQDESVRINVGWVIIGISAIIILWNFILILYQLLIYILNLVKKVVLSIFQSKSKVVPINSQPSLNNVQTTPNNQTVSQNNKCSFNNKQNLQINLKTSDNNQINDQITPINNQQNIQNILKIPLNNQTVSIINKSTPSNNIETTPRVNQTTQNMNVSLLDNQQLLQPQQQKQYQIKLNLMNNSQVKGDQKSTQPQKGDYDDQDKNNSICNSMRNNELNIPNNKPQNFSSFNALYSSSKNRSYQDLNTYNTPQRNQTQKQENQNEFFVKRNSKSKKLRITIDDTTVNYSHLKVRSNLKIVDSRQKQQNNKIIISKSENQIIN